MTDILTQLSEYLDGHRRKFDVPLDMRGTEFQHKVWNELRNIPYGHTISYGEVAKRIGRPAAIRAVARAIAANRIWIIVPCHRVIGADGRLTGYAGGLEMKRLLLSIEAGHVLADDVKLEIYNRIKLQCSEIGVFECIWDNGHGKPAGT